MINSVCFFVKQIYGSSVNGPVRHKCLSVIGKLMYFSTAEMIQSLLSSTNISRYPTLIDYGSFICSLTPCLVRGNTSSYFVNCFALVVS